MAYTTESFIEKAKLIHGDKYDYSKVNYVNVKTKIIVICPIHGEFETTPDNHINGKTGCPKCGGVYNYTNEEWINECKIKHYNKYDYSQVNYVNAKSKVKIICHEKDEFGVEHGEFEIRASNHISGVGCPKCGKRITYNKDSFIKKSNNIYLNLNQKLNNIGVVHDDGLCIKNFVIKYVNYNENCEQSAIDYYHNYKKNNYTSIIIFPDEFHYKHNMVVNKLKHIINLEDNYQLPKIYGRHCEIKEIDFEIVKPFLEKYHIQGSAIGTVHLGAYYNNNLIGVMSFLKEKKDGNWNLTRFATDINYICCGVGGKLFKYFIKNYDYKQIKSFADRRWTINENDNIYTKLGFKLDSITCKDYRYYNLQVDKYQRYKAQLCVCEIYY